MGRLWTLATHLHSLAGPVTTLLYPLYASVIAIESTTKVDDEQWLAYWILYSFLTLIEMLLQPILQWIPIWHDVKLVFVAWLVLPQFRGAAYLYEKFVREQIRKHGRGEGGGGENGASTSHHHHGKAPQNKFVRFIAPNKGEQEAY